MSLTRWTGFIKFLWSTVDLQVYHLGHIYDIGLILHMKVFNF